MQFRQIRQSQSKINIRFNSQIKLFGLILFLYQIILCIMYGFFLNYDVPLVFNKNELYLPASISLIALIGFGLIYIYLESMTIAGMGFTLLLFCICIQQYFLSRQFWLMVGTAGESSIKPFGSHPLSIISLTNLNNDRQITNILSNASFVDAMASGLSMIVALGSVFGRIGPLQILVLGTLGTFIYEINNQIFWNLYITDCGYGMRIFLFGSSLGIISSLILGKRDTTQQSSLYKSSYFSETYSLIGMSLLWCFFPVLCLSDVYHLIGFDRHISAIVILNMWFGLIGGIIGSYSASILIHKKIIVAQIIFSGLSGGLIFSSTADLIFNPAFPLTAGTLAGLSVTALNYLLKNIINQNGTIDSYGTVISYFFPTLIGGILSSALQATGPVSKAYYTANSNPKVSNFSAGGLQIAGICIAIGLGCGAGCIVGLLYKLINKNKQQNQFNDQTYYQAIVKEE